MAFRCTWTLARLYDKRLKETLAAHREERGNKFSYTMKLSRDRHGKLLAAVDKHGMTITGLLTQLHRPGAACAAAGQAGGCAGLQEGQANEAGAPAMN